LVTAVSGHLDWCLLQLAGCNGTSTAALAAHGVIEARS